MRPWLGLSSAKTLLTPNSGKSDQAAKDCAQGGHRAIRRKPAFCRGTVPLWTCLVDDAQDAQSLGRARRRTRGGSDRDDSLSSRGSILRPLAATGPAGRHVSANPSRRQIQTVMRIVARHCIPLRLGVPRSEDLRLDRVGKAPAPCESWSSRNLLGYEPVSTWITLSFMDHNLCCRPMPRPKLGRSRPTTAAAAPAMFRVVHLQVVRRKQMAVAAGIGYKFSELHHECNGDPLPTSNPSGRHVITMTG